MATLIDALPKSLADTIYTARPADLTAVALATPVTPTWNDSAKSVTIPTVVGMDYYEFRGVTGWFKVTGTVTASITDGNVNRLQARPLVGYALKGNSTFLYAFPA